MLLNMATISILIALYLVQVGIGTSQGNPYYSSTYYHAGTVGFNPAFNPYNTHYGNYMMGPWVTPFQYTPGQTQNNVETTTETTTTEITTTTTAPTTMAPTTTKAPTKRSYDFNNMRYLCHLTGNWNLEVENGWLQMRCVYDYIDLLKLLHDSLRMEGFLVTKQQLDNAWYVSSSIYHRDGFVSICKRYCEPGTWPIIRSKNMTNADSMKRSHLNIGCANLNDEYCEPICVEEIRKVENGNVSCSKGLFLASVCELKCNFGHYPTAYTVKTCDSTTKKWTHNEYPFECKAYTTEQLMSVVSMIPEEEREDTDLSDRKSILNVILTKFMSSNKTQEELQNDPDDMFVKNEVLSKIIQAFYNDTKPGSIVLKSYNTQADQCSGNAQARIECGYPGISQRLCEKNNCCYDSSVANVKWCFKKNMGRKHLKDTTPLPNGEIYDGIRVTSRSPHQQTTFGTMGGGQDLINMLEHMGLRKPITPPTLGPFGSMFTKPKKDKGNNFDNNNEDKNNYGGFPIHTYKKNTFQAKCICESSTPRNMAVNCGGMGQGTVARIICGTPTLPEKWPWHVIIYYGIRVCGGTLIANNYVVTAAHCFSPDNGKNDRNSNNRLFFGVANVHQRSGKEQVSGIKAIHRHPGFFQDGSGHLLNDIALVELSNPIKITKTVRPICLPNERKPTVANRHKCYVTGFGKTGQAESLSAKLRYAELPIVETKRCLNMYNADNEVNSVLCAGTIGSKSADTCQGDSGGPMFCTTDVTKPPTDTCTWYLAGVTSFGQTPCGQGFPGVYTNVAHYENWLKEIMAT